MGKKHKRFREFWTPILLRVIRKNPRSMYARVSKVMAQFVLKIEKLSHIMGPAPILEMARAFGLRPRLWLLPTLISHVTYLNKTSCKITQTSSPQICKNCLFHGNCFFVLCSNLPDSKTDKVISHANFPAALIIINNYSLKAK